MNIRPPGVLVLADGSVFEGELIGWLPANERGAGERPDPGATYRLGTDGAPAPWRAASGEVVFNTALSGYQEIITDPSYAGQIITFTNPHIGNYGVNVTDFESRRAFCRGVVVRDLARRPSNRRSQASLGELLAAYGVPGVAGIDTRRLTRLVRDTGAIPGAIGPAEDLERITAVAATEPGTDGIDLVATVTALEPYVVGSGEPTIVAYDFGIKRTILRHLARLGAVEVVPASTPAADVIARDPAGIFLSNGPGDPACVAGATDAISELLGTGIPIFGICLGHQLLGRALGAATVKLPFGHHGANHPVKDLTTGRIEITSQNHNFAVAVDDLGGVASVSHVNLNDGVCEGLQADEANAFGVQHHPEAGPGPHESSYLFARFAERIVRHRGGGWSPSPSAPLVPATEPLGLPEPDRGVA